MGLLLGGHLNLTSAGGGEVRVLNTTITRATHFYKKKPKEIEFEGFDAGADPKGFPNFGSIANGSYIDADSNAHVVSALYVHSTGQFPTFLDALWLNVTGTAVNDDDITFSKIVVDGTTFTRASRSATGGGSTSRWWRWNSAGNPFGVNPNPFEVWVI